MEDNTNNAYPNFSPMKNQDGRYAAVKLFVENGTIKTFEEIFPAHFPKTKFASELGKHPDRMEAFVERVDIIKVETIDRIADLFGLDPGLVFKIIHTQYVQKIKNTTHSKTHKAAKRKKTKNQ
jgi:plasmid maintenance system antidote protein VapI